MPSWISISFSNGRNSNHLILPWVLQILRAVYEHCNISASESASNEPQAPMEDDFNYQPYLSYQVRPGTSELTRASLIVRESSGSGPLVTHYAINLLTGQVHDHYEDIHTVVPEEAGSAVSRIRDWLKGEVIRIKESREQRTQAEALEKEKAQERRKQQIQIFSHRLSESTLGDVSSFDESGGDDTCPLCDRKLVQCKDCDAVSCENVHCAASKLLSIVGCLEHPEEYYCRTCLHKQGSWPQVAQCPNCAAWSCSSDLGWCQGRPETIITFNEESSLAANVQEDAIQPRAHHPKPAPCSQCESNGVSPWRNCYNIHCWSRSLQSAPAGDLTLCPECSPGDGITCVCGRTWNCEDCSTASSNTSIDRCSGCHTVYCGICSYIERCVICTKARLCNDCVEDEDGQQMSDVVNLREICRTCLEKICESCSKLEGENRYQCPWCSGTICKLCAEFRPCTDCRVPLCRRSRCNFRRCQQCIKGKKAVAV
ncbi:hypothetical protein BJ138DRAFT_1144726, partial [Hygrophoropsis aurantiaca]